MSKSSIENTVAIEDSSIGYQSAHSAGLKCIITLSPWLVSPEEKMQSCPIIVDNLGEASSQSKILQGNICDTHITFATLNSFIKSNDSISN